jgi:hypothetical protein
LFFHVFYVLLVLKNPIIVDKYTKISYKNKNRVDERISDGLLSKKGRLPHQAEKLDSQ